MLIKDVLTIACEFVNERDLGEKLSQNLTDEEEIAKRDRLLKCFNLVQNEIASEFVPCITKESVYSNGEIEFSSLSKKPVKIISICDEYGRKQVFKEFDGFIEVSEGEKIVEYSFLPDEVTIDDEIYSKVPERVFAYGVAKEYFVMEEFFQEADIYEMRFKNSLASLKENAKNIVMPKRRWI